MYGSLKNHENNNIYEDGENVLWDDEEENTATDADTDELEIRLYEKIQRQTAEEQRFIDELEDDVAERPIEGDEDVSEEEQPERKLLKRDLQAQALSRLEDAARTLKDFENVIAWQDKLDANRQRRERYHELSRGGDDIPLDFGASEDALCFPDALNNVLEKQQRKGDFIDTIFYCPYDIHELVAEEYMSSILQELTEDHKFLLFLCALQQYSSTKIAVIRGQTDRNIRKVRGTILKKIRKKLFAALTKKIREKQPLTLLEKDFLSDSGLDIERLDIEKDKKQ